MNRRLILCTITFLSLGIASCAGAPPAAKKYTIAVIPKGTTQEYWESVHAGALKAAQEIADAGTNVSIIWKGPIREDDREQQIQVVEGFTSQGVDGIVLAPLDDRALIRPVEEAKRAGIPTLIMDSALRTDQIVSFVATDNGLGGELAASRIGLLLGGQGRIMVLRYQENSASTTEREEGFLRRIRSGYPGITVISSDQYAGPTRDTAKRASENLLNRFGGEVQGIFCPSESSTAGMLLALQDSGRAGKVVFVGFDSGKPFMDAMRNNQMQGLVLQNPTDIGYLGVKTLMDSLLGRSVEKRIDTGVTLLTPEDLKRESEIRK
jgi:ribose transport system substrate-binding protein